MSNQIGQMTKTFKDGKAQYEGYARTLNLDVSLRLVPNPHKTGDGPDYKTLVKNQTGEFVEVGAAWINQSKPKMIGDEPTEYLSIHLDDPSFQSELRFTAFESRENPDIWNLVWSRVKPQAA